MKTPAFWKDTGVISSFLLPLASLYDVAGMAYRRFVVPEKLSVPVICIGNITAGGAGKTPVALHIGQILKEHGAFFLSRGYGGSAQGPLLVDAQKHRAGEVGDEPLLLAKILPTVVAKDRLNGAKFAITQGAKLIIMDDGFQNPAIAKTLSLLVIDGAGGFGNGRIIPAGPLRESPASGFTRAHAVVVVNPTSQTPDVPKDKPLLTAKMVTVKEMTKFHARKLFAFCGIAHPQKFSETLAGLGADVVETVAFADHHPYSPHDIKKLLARATAKQATLVTTAKDAVRIPPELRKQVEVVEIEIVFDHPERLDMLLGYAVGKA